MATNPNKAGSLAYSVWEKNNAMKTTTPVSNTGTVSWWPQATAEAIANSQWYSTSYNKQTPLSKTESDNLKNNPMIQKPTAIQATPIKPVVSTPALNKNLDSYKFGQEAMVANQADNSYLSKRNTDFASDYSTKGIKDYQSVYNELNKNVNFQKATQQDKDNTAKSIYDQLQKTAVTPTPATSNTGSANWRESGQPFSTVSTKVGDETYSSVDYDKRIKQVDDYLATPWLSETERRAAEVAREEQIRLKNAEAQATSNFGADTQFIKDSNQWTLDDNQRKYDEEAVQLNRKLEEAKLTTDRQIEDIRKMTDRNIALQEKSGALSGMNRWAGFTQWLNNIKRDSLDTINRLQADLENYNASVWLAKASAYQTYTDNKNRAIEKFTNQYKDLLNNTNTDLNKAMWKFPDFSDEKLKKQLAIIKEWYYGQSQQIFGSWVDQMNSINQDARAESDQIMKLEQFANMQEDRLLTQWAGKDWEWYLTLTQKDLQWLVDSGQIKPSTALASFNLMKSKAQMTINALAVNKVATPEETQAVMDAMAQGMTPQQAIAKVVASNPARFVQVTNTQDWSKLDDWRLYNQRTGEIKSADWTTSTSGWYQWPVIPPVQQQVVENNIQQVQSIQDWSQWGQCGSFVNNYLWKLWLGRLFEDPITKPYAKDWETAKADIANSQVPKVWSVFITDSEQFPQYWHVGIVTKVNSDWSFETKESNKAGEWKVFSRIMQPWQAKYGFFDPTIWKKATSNGTWPNAELNTLSEFLIDTQPRWQGYSDWDVAAYTNAIKKYAERGDRATVIQLYRDQVLKWKENDTLLKNGTFIKQNIEWLNRLMKEYEAEWWNMNIFRGNIQKLTERLWESGDPKLVEIWQKIGMMTADYIRSISGTAASDVEVERLIKLLPSVTSTFDRNAILSKWFSDRVVWQARSWLEVTMGKNKAMLDELFPELANNQPNTTTTNQPTQSWWGRRKK